MQTLWRLLQPMLAALKPPAPAPEPTSLPNPAGFFDAIRAGLFKRLSQSQVDGINSILKATVGLPISYRAYILTTSYHETDKKMQPIREYGRGRGKRYGNPGPHGGQIAYGRGHVQLTWPENYERADEELRLNGALLSNYDLALDPKIAADILVGGMLGGWFTGKKLADYLPQSGLAAWEDLRDARRIINGVDRAALLADYAMKFQTALRHGGAE